MWEKKNNSVRGAGIFSIRGPESKLERALTFQRSAMDTPTLKYAETTFSRTSHAVWRQSTEKG